MSDLGEDQRVMPHRVLEWCQDAATHASSAAGYTTERYLSMNAAWYIRGLSLTLQCPCRFDDEVVVETWVSNLRRFRSQREYLVYANGEIAARAHADWMFLKLDPATSKVRPFHLDEAMQAAFPVDDSLAIDPPDLLAMPREFELPPPIQATRRTAQPSEADRYQHVNHVHYAAWVTDHYRETRDPSGRLLQIRLLYQADVKPGETVDLELAIDGEEARHRLTRNGQPIARAATRFAATGE